MMDSEAYLKRIGYTGSLEPTAVTLRDLHLAHLYSVPFENLDIHLGNPIQLTPAQLFDKIVRRRRGGFCYELNGLFAWLLGELGFEVTLLSARVANEAGVFGPEFDHLTLKVACPAGADDGDGAAGPWLADVGFGDSFRLPLRMDTRNIPQPDGMGVYRLSEERLGLALRQRQVNKVWLAQYRLSEQPRQLADFGPMCTYHQTSPDSHFTQRRVCTMARIDGRVTLTEQKLIITTAGKRTEQPIEPAGYESILAEQFGMTL